jgi:hypothetical protein
MAKTGNQINFKGNNRDNNNQGIVKLTNYFDSKLGNICGITMSNVVCDDKCVSSTIDIDRQFKYSGLGGLS